MATEKTDVVIVGMGAVGGILAAELGKAGMKVIGLERGPRLMRATAFAIRASDEAWQRHWRTVPEPGWHDLFALTKRGVASIEGDLRPLLQNLQYFKDLLALPRRLPPEN